MKKIFAIIVLLTVIGVNGFSQIPTNGLVGYWPFNGNANDVSVNSNNGTVNGAILTTDRFGNANSAYSFATGDIELPLSNVFNTHTGTIVMWFKLDSVSDSENSLFSMRGCDVTAQYFTTFDISIDNRNASNGNLGVSLGKEFLWSGSTNNGWDDVIGQSIFSGKTDTAWNCVAVVHDGIQPKLYLNGILQGSIVSNADITKWWDSLYNAAIYPLQHLKIGARQENTNVLCRFQGKIDDIRIYNLALSQTEIASLYNEGLCYQMITVTDTLIINASITGYHPVTYLNTIKIYPNPTSDHINIDYGNYSSMINYTLMITNSLGQTVFTSPVNQPQSYIDLSSWSGNGLYFVYLKDSNNSIVDVKKIVLQ